VIYFYIGIIMCGRFALLALKHEIELLIDGIRGDEWPEPSYNISPGQTIACILNDGTRALTPAIWGLVPQWAKTEKASRGFINARAETLAQKPSFRKPLIERRCIILASGFYEWKSFKGAPKIPYYFRMKTGLPFAFAGLWEPIQCVSEKKRVCTTIITISPNTLMAEIHDRMPVILPKSSIDSWLQTGKTDPDASLTYLKTYPSDEMECYPVTNRVNSPAFNDASCIIPLKE
jgi:putative SOS response-associated peptidase YedK